MPITIGYQTFESKLKDNTLILAPNSRTVSAINAGFTAPLAEGEVVYAQNVDTLSGWQSQLLEMLSFKIPVPRLIGSLEIKTWLKDLITQEENWILTNELGVAEKVLEAYRTLVQWNLSVDDLGTLETTENQYFAKWAEALENYFAEKRLIAKFGLSKFLLSNLSDLKNFLPAKILMLGFNQLTPSEEAFIFALKSLGVEIEDFFPQQASTSQQRIEFDQLKDEIAFAANLSHKLTLGDPDKTIAVVVNQLASHIDTVHQCFSEVFQPQENYPWQPLEKTRYNVSAGQSLADIPSIFIAIKILQLNSQGLDLETLQLLKNSPFIDWGVNKNEIKAFLNQQWNLGYRNYSLDYLIKAIENNPEKEKLETLLTRLQAIENRPYQARPMMAWIDSWKSELLLWGWMQSETLKASSNQIELDFYHTLKESISLSSINPKPTRKDAFEFLQQLLRQATFQLPSDRTNVHILGVLEASGLVFDDLVLVGFSRSNWPQKAQANPFLPILFQQQYATPGSSAEREFAYTENLSNSLLQSANKVWVTYSKTEDENLTGESPLFSKLPIAKQEIWISPADSFELETDYQWVTDEKIKLATHDIKGGAYMLSYYGACPFKAMSQFQFGLKVPEQTELGIDAKTRGAWLHKALELFWIQVKNSNNLKTLSDEKLEQIIAECLNESKQEFEAQLYATAPVEVIQLEFNKLAEQIFQWLELDKQAGDYSVKTEIEEKLTLGPLSFKFRIDRLDEYQDNSIGIVDYKTGRVDVKKWLGKRPDEAQMPAYLLAYDNALVNNLSYAKIKTGEIQKVGVWFNNSDVTKKIDNYRFKEVNLEGEKDRTKYLLANPDNIDRDKSLAEQWRENLEHLVENIADGKMPVSPKNIHESCRYCAFTDFCRINEIQPKDLNAEKQPTKTSHHKSIADSEVNH